MINTDQLINNKKLLLISAIIIFVGLIILLVVTFNKPSTPSGTYDSEGNFYSDTGDIFYAEPATEEPDAEPELYL